MARPQKNNCDYFSHDADMRNHKKVKALRATFGVSGYAVWSMILEYLTGSDGNVFPYTDLEFELMSGDFGVSVTEIRGVVDYCIRLEMLFNKNGFINSESLDERLVAVYQKRGRAKELSKKQLRMNGKFANSNTDSNGVSVTEMPQSKVKESKENKIPPIGGVGVKHVDFLLEVKNVGGDIYTDEMLKRFSEYWTEPIVKGKDTGKEKWQGEKTWKLTQRLSKWAERNLDGIVCYREDDKSIKEKKIAFKTELKPFLDTYGKDMINAFYLHWSQPENVKHPKKLKWELEDSWELKSRLISWKARDEARQDPAKKEEKYRITPDSVNG